MPGKIRIGFIVAKDNDPVKPGTVDPSWPAAFKIPKNQQGWGGAYHVDVAEALKFKRIAGDEFEIDLIHGRDVTLERLSKNALNFNLAYDQINAWYSEDMDHYKRAIKAFKSKKSNHWPEWDFQQWIIYKPAYMRQCQKAGIPINDTIFVEKKEERDARKLLAAIHKKGWKKFLIKPGFQSCWGQNVLHNQITEDLLKDPSSLEEYFIQTKKESCFLVQPYTVKPNGEVFDEIRCYIIDGQYGWAVFTHGTDDNKVYEQPPGKDLDECRKIAEAAYKEVQKVCLWRGKRVHPPLMRMDVAVMPDKSQPGGMRYFLNEIEKEGTNQLTRYVGTRPGNKFNLVDRMAEVYVRKAKELLGMHPLPALSWRPDATSGKASAAAKKRPASAVSTKKRSASAATGAKRQRTA